MRKKKAIFKLIIIFLILFFIFSSIYTLLNKQKIDNNSNTIEKYQIYFCPENDCNNIIYNLFQTYKDINCAVYNINIDWILNSKAKLIIDNEEFEKIKENYPNNTNIKTDLTKSYMHNKFCVFDNNLLLIGSTNFNYDSFTKQNNNFILTSNIEQVNEAKKQFNDYWKGNFNAIEPKENICFSPDNDCANYFIREAKTANYRIKCMFYSFTYKDFSKALLDKNFDVKIIFEKSQNSQYSQYEFLKENNIKVLWDQNPSLMHNKFCIFDNKVITGSFNMSNNANFNNNESIIIIDNKEITELYNNYFEKYYTLWGYS
jgi:hypothetical protein